jgi:hypothetical protein
MIIAQIVSPNPRVFKCTLDPINLANINKQQIRKYLPEPSNLGDALKFLHHVATHNVAIVVNINNNNPAEFNVVNV